MRAVRIDTPPQIDGVLTDSCWAHADIATNFRQTRPHEREFARHQTEVRILYDEHYLYIGFRCHDDESEKLVNRLLPRDAISYPNDNIDFIIDSYFDRQNAYYFQVNTRGVKYDAGFDMDGNWDGVWWCETSIDSAGWCAEIKIPFKTLRFPRKSAQTWGMNFGRQRQADGERSVWANASRHFNITTVHRAGDVTDFKNLKPGLHLEILPYITGRHYQQQRPENQRTLDSGLDVKYGIAPNLKLDLTLNPDFAHIEADEAQINLTRFELHLNEKRPFFMENRKIFDTPIELFYTRRIANPSVGSRLTGKIGRTNVAVLHAVDETDAGENPNYTIIRAKQDIFEKSSVAFYSVNKDWRNEFARALGFDSDLYFGERFTLDAQIARSINPGITKNDWAGEMTLWKGGAHYDIEVMYRKIEPEFNVEHIGYAPHDAHIGSRRYSLWTGISDRLPDWHLKTLSMGHFAVVNRDTDDPGWEWLSQPSIYFAFFKEIQFSIEYGHHHFLYQGVSYDQRQWMLGHENQVFRKLKYELFLATGDQMDWQDGYFGRIREATFNVSLNPLDRWTLDAALDNVWEYRPDGAFDELKRVGYLRSTLLFTRELFWRIFASGSKNTQQYFFNTLLGWEYRPNSRFYIAYNEEIDASGRTLKLKNRVIFLKLAYLHSL